MYKQIALLLALLAGNASAAGYHVVARWQHGGDGGWDYLTVDPAAHRLYFGRSTRVQVLDTASGKLVGEIPDTPGIHGVALAPALGRGFTSNGRDSTVTIFELGTLKTLARVHIDGRNPDAILFEPTTRRVFTFNGGSNDAIALDAATGAVVGKIALGGKPEFAVADGKGRMFVNLEDSSAVLMLDPKSLAVTARWPLAPGEEPSGLRLDARRTRGCSACARTGR
jgi:DNA-binding beta-propeller fold protein YncE